MEQTEYIRVSEDDADSWVCLCGNTPHGKGFFPCDGEGVEIDPGLVWDGLFVCDQCGRIIEANNLKVAGRRTRFEQTVYKPGEREMPALPLGGLVITPKAEEALEESRQSPAIFLHMYLTGNWGECSKDDWNTNDAALETGGRVQGVYYTANGEEIWIITEANRSATTILTPEEY